MAVIFALLLVLWGVGRSEKFALCTGHGNGSKIDFISAEYFAVARYPRAGRNLEICFQKARRVGGLHNRYYQRHSKTMINKEFCC